MKLNKKSLVAAVATGSVLVASSAHAVDIGASITTAFSTAQTNVGTVVVGVITLAAIATGVALILKFISK